MLLRNFLDCWDGKGDLECYYYDCEGNRHLVELPLHKLVLCYEKKPIDIIHIESNTIKIDFFND